MGEKNCTCTGTCKGAFGLGDGWRCVLSPVPAPAREETPCMAKLTVFVKEYRGDNAVVFVQTDQPGLHHYPFTVPIRELSHFSAIKLPLTPRKEQP